MSSVPFLDSCAISTIFHWYWGDHMVTNMYVKEPWGIGLKWTHTKTWQKNNVMVCIISRTYHIKLNHVNDPTEYHFECTRQWKPGNLIPFNTQCWHSVFRPPSHKIHCYRWTHPMRGRWSYIKYIYRSTSALLNYHYFAQTTNNHKSSVGSLC